MKVTGLNALNFPIRQTKRAQRSASAQPNPAIRTQAADEVAIAPPKRKYVRKNAAKSKASPAAEDTVTVSLSKEAPPSQVQDIYAVT